MEESSVGKDLWKVEKLKERGVFESYAVHESKNLRDLFTSG